MPHWFVAGIRVRIWWWFTCLFVGFYGYISVRFRDLGFVVWVFVWFAVFVSFVRRVFGLVVSD